MNKSTLILAVAMQASGSAFSGACVFPTSCGTNGTADGVISLYYDYTPYAVPEPASLALMGIGFVGLSSIRHKKV